MCSIIINNTGMESTIFNYKNKKAGVLVSQANDKNKLNGVEFFTISLDEWQQRSNNNRRFENYEHNT